MEVVEDTGHVSDSGSSVAGNDVGADIPDHDDDMDSSIDRNETVDQLVESEPEDDKKDDVMLQDAKVEHKLDPSVGDEEYENKVALVNAGEDYDEEDGKYISFLLFS